MDRVKEAGGPVMRTVGWVVIVAGVIVGSFITWLLMSLGSLGYLIGGPVAIMAILVGIALIRGGRYIQERAGDETWGAQVQKIYTLAEAKSGELFVSDIVRSLSVTPVVADALLTRLAREQPDEIRVDIDPTGGICYRFSRIAPRRMAELPPASNDKPDKKTRLS